MAREALRDADNNESVRRQCIAPLSCNVTQCLLNVILSINVNAMLTLQIMLTISHLWSSQSGQVPKQGLTGLGLSE